MQEIILFKKYRENTVKNCNVFQRYFSIYSKQQTIFIIYYILNSFVIPVNITPIATAPASG